MKPFISSDSSTRRLSNQKEYEFLQRSECQTDSHNQLERLVPGKTNHVDSQNNNQMYIVMNKARCKVKLFILQNLFIVLGKNYS